MKIRLVKCDCCEKEFGLDKLIRDGGLKLCKPCKAYIDVEYPKLMAEEARE